MWTRTNRGFVRDMVEGKVTTDKDGAKKEYADRITKDPLPKTYDNKMDEDVVICVVQ